MSVCVGESSSSFVAERAARPCVADVSGEKDGCEGNAACLLSVMGDDGGMMDRSLSSSP